MTVCTDRDLLRQAWPLGYLPVEGLSTIGGWTCVEGINPIGLMQWRTPEGTLMRVRTIPEEEYFNLRYDSKYRVIWEGPPPLSMADIKEPTVEDIFCSEGGEELLLEQWKQALKNGDLLPMVDPSNEETWTLLVKNLMHTCGQWNTSTSKVFTFGFEGRTYNGSSAYDGLLYPGRDLSAWWLRMAYEPGSPPVISTAWNPEDLGNPTDCATALVAARRRQVQMRIKGPEWFTFEQDYKKGLKTKTPA